MGRLRSLLQWVLITHQDKFRGLFENNFVANNVPVEDMNTSSKISFGFGIGILRIVTGHTKTYNIGKFIIIDMVTYDTILITHVLNVNDIRCLAINPTRYIRETITVMNFTGCSLYISIPCI